MPDQRQPDQPIDRNRDLDRNQQIERQDQQGMQGSQADRQNRQNFQDAQSDRQNQQNLQGSQQNRQTQGGQGSSSMSGGNTSSRDRDTGLDMSQGENRSGRSGMQEQDRMQTREGQQRGREQSDEMSRGDTSYTDEGIGRPYDSDDMEAQSPDDIDSGGYGDSRIRDDQRGRNQTDR